MMNAKAVQRCADRSQQIATWKKVSQIEDCPLGDVKLMEKPDGRLALVYEVPFGVVIESRILREEDLPTAYRSTLPSLDRQISNGIVDICHLLGKFFAAAVANGIDDTSASDLCSKLMAAVDEELEKRESRAQIAEVSVK